MGVKFWKNSTCTQHFRNQQNPMDATILKTPTCTQHFRNQQNPMDAKILKTPACTQHSRNQQILWMSYFFSAFFFLRFALPV